MDDDGGHVAVQDKGFVLERHAWSPFGRLGQAQRIDSADGAVDASGETDGDRL